MAGALEIFGVSMGMLLSGTASAVGQKVVYQHNVTSECPGGLAPQYTTFAKPYFFTLTMFIGEALCLLWYYLDREFDRARSKNKKGYASDTEALLGLDGSPASEKKPPAAAGSPKASAGVPQRKPPLWVFAVLSLFDLSATTIGSIGLIWVDASVNQMLRGSGVVFTAIFSIMLLKSRLAWKQWVGIGIVCAGLVLVGLSGYLGEGQSGTVGPPVSPFDSLIGIIFVLIGSALNAVQGVLEEKLMKAVGGAEVSPLELTGWEGVFGTIFCASIMLPAVNFIPGPNCGSQENIFDTLYLLRYPIISAACLTFIFALMIMNFLSQKITQLLSAVHRQLISSIRTLMVWGVDLVIYYFISRSVGESWETKTSLIELAGFCCLVAGTFVYGRNRAPPTSQ
jgi:drug/metabolite transporter (DMT)-like permease